MSKISVGTWVRTIVLIIALLNQILLVLGKNPLPISEEQIYALVSTVATIIAAAVAWWENNSFTDAARRGDAVMNEAIALRKLNK